MLRRVALVKINVSEDRSPSIIRVTRIVERLLLLIVTANVVRSSPILVTLMFNAIRSYETCFLTRATWRNITEDAILHSHRRENHKSLIALTDLNH
jgi:hypothetical protein